MSNIRRLFATATVLLLCGSAGAATKPNVVYILVDNWGWGDLSIQGSTVATPRIDQFAREGLRLTNFNVQNQCTPTRSALHTGRLPIRSGTQKVAAPGEPDGLAPWEYTIAELFSDAGYATALYGKWHIGSKPGRLPNDQGYDQWWGINEGSNAAAYTSTPQFDPTVAEVPHIWQGVEGEISHTVRIYDKQAKNTLDRETVKRTIAFIKKNVRSKTPFFSYVGFTHFHPPWGVHPDFVNRSKSGLYADTKMEVDYNVGMILDAIDKAGIEDNTIVILTGDNGAANYPSPGLVTGEVGGSNGPWRGGLSTAYEGGMRTPAMVRWPGNIPAGEVSDEIVADLDWFPTLANLIGESNRIPTDRPMDGINQADFILGAQAKSSREYAVTYVGDTVFAVKWRNMKMHFAAAEGTHSVVQTFTFPQLYDIKDDPKESYELWGNEGYAHAWVMGPVTKILTGIAQSMAVYPNIKPGQDFQGYGVD
ncbi:MAG: arylsulfatase [Halieaceae bacterium]|jgi:arylsulfatase A-like enzyme|nr:arylsulfatase [Halieaceae bacterium]